MAGLYQEESSVLSVGHLESPVASHGVTVQAGGGA